MRTLSTAMAVELGLTVTRPGYLVRLGYSTTLYLSTLGDVSWDGQAWIAKDMKVSSVSQSGAGSNTGALEVGNTDDAFGALVLNEGASEIPVTVWAVYAGATATDDPVMVFNGVTDGADISTSRVSFSLVPQRNDTLYSPRVFINKAAGFNFLQPAGTRIAFGNETFVLERAGS